MCPKCEGFAARIEIKHPLEIHRLVGEIEQVLAEGTLAFAGGNCSLSDIRPDRPWPQDYIEQAYRCPACEQRFQLSVETYHGSGGSWDAA